MEEEDTDLLLYYDRFVEEEQDRRFNFGFLSKLRGNKTLSRNLIIMAGCWLTGCFCYYLMNFYVKYLPGNIFQNVLFSSSADVIGFVATGFIF